MYLLLYNARQSSKTKFCEHVSSLQLPSKVKDRKHKIWISPNVKSVNLCLFMNAIRNVQHDTVPRTFPSTVERATETSNTTESSSEKWRFKMSGGVGRATMVRWLKLNGWKVTTKFPLHTGIWIEYKGQQFRIFECGHSVRGGDGEETNGSVESEEENILYRLIKADAKWQSERHSWIIYSDNVQRPCDAFVFLVLCKTCDAHRAHSVCSVDWLTASRRHHVFHAVSFIFDPSPCRFGRLIKLAKSENARRDAKRDGVERVLMLLRLCALARSSREATTPHTRNGIILIKFLIKNYYLSKQRSSTFCRVALLPLWFFFRFASTFIVFGRKCCPLALAFYDLCLTLNGFLRLLGRVFLRQRVKRHNDGNSAPRSDGFRTTQQCY